MSIISLFHSKEHIQEQACLWVSRMDRGLNSNEKQALVSWCKQNTAHYKMLLEIASYWDDLTVLNELSGLFPLENSSKRITQKITAIAMAASLAIVSVLGVNALMTESFIPTIFGTKNTQQLTKLYKTRVGEQNSFTLIDGTHIQLNTNSIVNVAYTKSYRQLTLVQGEAEFNVAKDKSRPFTVIAGEKSFTALGTIFNVQKNNEQVMELVVTEGRVLITKSDENMDVIKQTLANISPNLPLENLPGILVISGEKAVLTHNAKNTENPVHKVSLDQVQRDLAWQQGMLIFNGEPLSKALLEISRYTSSKFEILDPQLSDFKVAGYFKANDIDGLLASLHSNFNIVFTKDDNNTILLSAAN